MADIIDVNVIVFPDGSTYWAERDFDTEGKDIRDRVDKWEKDNPRYKDQDVDLAICTIKMLREDYNNIPADINAPRHVTQRI